jgi:hypothetical protein
VTFARLPACARGDARHEHTRSCLPILVERLPALPAGWAWKVGPVPTGWSVWIESASGGSFHVVEMSPASTVAGLAAIVDAYLAGVDHSTESVKLL